MMKIISIEELKTEAVYDNSKGMAEFFILLNFNLRSGKRIIYNPKSNTFDIHNEIDDSFEDDLTEEQLIKETNIGSAIQNGCFFKYDL